jgi:hypothetical protein
MQERIVINASYYCQKGKRDGLFHVLNNGAYILAEYSEHTGELRWQRVVPAEQKKLLERWLSQHFPALTPKPA